MALHAKELATHYGIDGHDMSDGPGDVAWCI